MPTNTNRKRTTSKIWNNVYFGFELKDCFLYITVGPCEELITISSLSNVNSFKKARYGGQVVGTVFYLFLVVVEANHRSKWWNWSQGLGRRTGITDFKIPDRSAYKHHESEPSCKVTKRSKRWAFYSHIREALSDNLLESRWLQQRSGTNDRMLKVLISQRGLMKCIPNFIRIQA